MNTFGPDSPKFWIQIMTSDGVITVDTDKDGNSIDTERNRKNGAFPEIPLDSYVQKSS